MKKIFITPLLLFSLNIYSQSDINTFKHAYPSIGWDSLGTLIQRAENYPEIARRAGVTANISVHLSIDSSGNFISVEPTHPPFHQTDKLNNKLFIPSIENVLKYVKWMPASRNNKPVSDKIYVLFNFYLYDPENKTFNILAPVEKVK
jgi:hypothetical protein